MLISDFHAIGNKLLAARKRLGLTQAEVAEAAGLADRTYADIERGTTNMRVETVLRICGALKITPDDILTEQTDTAPVTIQDVASMLEGCAPKERETALKLLEVYLQSLNK